MFDEHTKRHTNSGVSDLLQSEHVSEQCGSSVNWKTKSSEWAIELKVNVRVDIVFFLAVADWWQF